MAVVSRRYGFKVNIGYTRDGHERNRWFETEAEARAFCSEVFDRTGVVLSIVEVR